MKTELFHYHQARFCPLWAHSPSQHYGVRIIVVKDIERSKSIEQELAEDLMSLIASFSGKLYGLRSKGNSNLGKES